MIETYKRLWFSTAVITLEDSKIEELRASKRYALITVLSYKKLDLPGFRCKEKDTSVISLSETEDEIFARMKDTTRNEIRRTLSSDALVFKGPIQLTDDVYTLYEAFEWAQGRIPIRKSEASRYSYFVAYHGDVPVSGISIRVAKPYVRIRSIFSKRLASEDKEEKKLIGNASRRLVWEICRWGKKEAINGVDMASVNLTEASKQGITAFKMSFGGETVKEYTYIWKSTMFSAFESLATARTLLRSALRHSRPV